MSKLFDKLRNAARKRSQMDAPSAILSLALRRAASEREQARADSQAAPADPQPDPVLVSSLVEAANMEQAEPEAGPSRDESPPPADDQHQRLKRGLALTLTALGVVAALIAVRTFVPSGTSAEKAKVPTFQLERELKSTPENPAK